MKNRVSKTVTVWIILGMLFLSSILTASAEQGVLAGKDLYAITPVGGEVSPVEIKSTKLTFNIPSLPESTGADSGVIPSQPATLLANYQLFNPTEKSASVEVALPIGRFKELTQAVGEYGVTVNGEAVSTELRHTYNYYHTTPDASFLRNEKINEGLYSPDTTVTEYELMLTDAEGSCDARFIIEGYGTERIIIVNGKLHSENKNGSAIVSVNMTPDKPVRMICIGEPLPNVLLQPELHELWTVADKIVEGTVEQTKNKKTTVLDEFVTRYYDPESGVGERDFFNAAVEFFRDKEEFPRLSRFENFYEYLMGWYTYEVTVNPLETVETEIFSPVVADKQVAMEPAVYRYYYTTMTAVGWAGLGSVEVEIITPYYMIYSYNLVGKQKTETGFSSFLEQPGTTEISFELCTVPDPEYVFEDDIFGDGSWFIGLLIFWGVVVLLVVGVPLVCIIIALVSFIKKRRKRGKSSENEAFHDSTKETEHDETE